MSPLVLAVLLAAQAPDAPNRTTLSNDRPEFPIGLATDVKLLEEVNQAAIREPEGVAGFMDKAAKEGVLIAVPSGTRSKILSTQKLRGPMFKEVVQVEVTQGAQKGLRGWVCSGAPISDKEFAALGAAGAVRKAEGSGYKPLYRDPIPGEKAYLAPQPTMFGMVRTLMRLAVADDSAWAVFQEWQGAPRIIEGRRPQTAGKQEGGLLRDRQHGGQGPESLPGEADQRNIPGAGRAPKRSIQGEGRLG